MNPFRFLALIGRGVLGAAERFFGFPPPKGTLYGALSEYLAPYENITQAETTEIGGVVSRAVQAGTSVTNTGNAPESLVPTIPSTEEDVGYLFRVVVNVTVPNIVPSGPPVKERILVPVIVNQYPGAAEILRMAEIAARTTYRERTTPEYLRKLLDKQETQVEAEQIVAMYNQEGIRTR